MSRVGPWDVMGELGRGGMGVVWQVRHHQSGLMGALKARRATRGELGWREVEALARLEHPNIIAIYDQGVLPGPLGDVPDGAPYYVMALARSSLSERLRERPLGWSEVRAVLEGVARALGHLHAHGLLHRDLKADNVLVMAEGPLTRRTVRLADFGLAERAGGRTGGTPRFMAPEQHSRRIGAIGPWTDLYALGLLGWVLVSGGLPSVARGDMPHAHAFAGLERLEAAIAVPRGFDALLRWLLEKAPERRPASAAEVLGALLALEEDEDENEDEVGRADGQAAEQWLSGLAGAALDGATLDTSTVDGMRLRGPVPGPARVEVEVRALEGTPGVGGTGLGLVGRRVYPLVGRLSALEVLGAAARRGLVDGVVTVAVNGPAGVGKSRLIDAFVASLAERRALRVVRLSESDDAVGLLTGLLALPRVLPVDEDLLEARLGDAPSWVRAVVRLALGAGAEVPAVLAAARWLWESSGVESVVVDDVDPSAGAFVTGLIGVRARGLILSSGALVGADVSVELGPLERDDALYLTREVLALEEGLAAAVVTVSQGHPATLVALLSSLVERGAMVAGAHGWALLDERPLVWLGAVLEGLEGGAAERARLEALGPEREAAERLLVALHVAGLAPRVERLAQVLGGRVEEVDGLGTRLAALGLVTSGERVGLARPALGAALVAARPELAFGLREAWARVLEDEAECGTQAERARVLTAWARQLEALGRPSAAVALRAARLHLLRGAAGEALAALDGVVGADAAVSRAEALVQLGRHEEGLVLLGPLRERADARWLDGQVARLAGRHGDALSAYDAVLAQEREPLARARTRVRKAMSLRELGRLDEAGHELEEARVLAAGEAFDRVLWLRAKAQNLRALGRHEEQLEVAQEAVALAEGLGSPGDYVAALTDFAGAANQLGRHADAMDALRRGQRVSRALGRADQAIDLLNLGLVGLSHGELGDADRDLEEAILALGRLGWDAPQSAAHALRLVSLGRLGAWERWGQHLAEAERLLGLTGVRDPDVKRALWEAVALAEAAGLEAERVGRVRALAVAQG